MPAYTTHTLFSHLALQALVDARHPLAAVAQQHAAMFRVAGIAGCDIQCMPYQVCRHCEAPYRHDQKENRICLVCREEALEDFSFEVSDGRRLKRTDVERELYANTHLVLYRKYLGYGVPPGVPFGPADQPLPEQALAHLANALRDAEKVAGRRLASNYLAFTLGWFSHVISDAIFKGVYLHAARVRFFGLQYHMAMLPAAETLTMSDLAYDFGVTWPVWHQELLRDEPDGGALRHLAMGNPPELYDPASWRPEFGQPNPAIGRVIDALRPINRQWFYRMYVQPDYSAPTPLLDKTLMRDRARMVFGPQRFDLGQLRRYAIGTGWYECFLNGISIYLRAVSEAAERAGLGKNSPFTIARETAAHPGVLDWSVWKSILEETLPRKDELEPGWGSTLRIGPECAPVLKSLRGEPVRLVLGDEPTDYQQDLAHTLATHLRLRTASPSGPRRWRGAEKAMRMVIGPPAYNRAAHPLLCREDAIRSKYAQWLAGMVRLLPEQRTLLLAGLSDFGDVKINDWLKSL